MELFLTVFPFVYVNKNKNDTIFYNTISGDSIRFQNNSFISEIASRLEQQDYACIVGEDEITQLNQVNFFTLLVEKNLGYYINKEHFSILPVSTQSVDINDSKIVSSFKNNEDIIENLREVTFYINSSICSLTCANQATFHKAYKQFLFPKCELQKNDLALSKIEKVIYEIGIHNVNINVLGGNTFDYPQYESLINLLNKSTHNIFYYFHYTDLEKENSQQLFSLLNKNDTKTVLVDFPFHEEYFIKWKKFIEEKNIQFEFIVESDSHINKAENIISKFGIQNYHFKPFYNENNFDFFKENVFISEEDILSVKESLFELITKKISNPSFFGKLTFDVHGNVYSNVNLPIISSIDNLNLKHLIYELITDDNSIWLSSRIKVEPCNKCIYNLLCPPISNYETTFGQNNLCYLNN